jgi:hypothetical protein
MTHPTIRNLERSAGFLEGEGYFGRHNNSEVISASQINLEPLAFLQRLFGGTISANPRRQRKRLVSSWRISGARARGVMMTLYSLLSSTRQTQIKIALGRVIR